jgi:transposase InsO family protein
MDFVMDALLNRRHLKCLTIVDDFTKESVDIVVDHGIPGLYVAVALDRAARFRHCVQTRDQSLRAAQSTSWACAKGVMLKFIQAGKPTQNAYIELFNGKFWDECPTNTCSRRSSMPGQSLRRGVGITIPLHYTHLSMLLNRIGYFGLDQVLWGA